jgi:translation initiation factor IF-3
VGPAGASILFAVSEVIGKIERGIRVNERIRAREVRLIDENGVQLGIMPSQDALRIARERDFDLIEVAPQAQPPVCRIMDYGKHKYEQAKREREARKKSRSSEVRLLRMKVQISQHDLDVKMRKVRELLAEGSKVRVSLRFRGREMSRPELGTNLLDRIREALADVANMEGQPRREGRMMSVMLVPKPGAKPPKEKQKEAPKPHEPEKAPAKSAEEKKEKATADVKEQIQEKPVAERPRQAEDTEDSGEAG